MLAYRLILAGILMVLLGGCAIPVAPFYDEPFPKDLQTKLNAGASQDEVVHLLGAPNATRLNGKFWYYGATRPVVVVAVPNGGGTILDYNWIEVAFDDKLRLQYAEHYESKSGCARSGNCLLWGEWGPVSEDNMTNQAIFTSPPEQDTAAKMFYPPVNGCAIYVFYASGTSFIARALLLDDVNAIGVGDTKTSWLNIDTYLRAEVPPGTVTIASGASRKQWNCATNDVGYFWVQEPFSGPVQIEEVDAATGKMEIARRRLLLPP